MNHPVLGPVYRGIVDGLELPRGSSWDRLGDIADLAAQLAGDPARRQRVERLLRVADLGISRIEARKLPPQTPDRDRYARRLVHDGDGQEYALPIDAESGGTLLWLQLVAAALRTLNSGSALLLDEIGASLHPVLTGELVRLFKDPQANPTGAQLIFTSHDTALLGHLLGDVLAREEIRFESSSGPTSRTTGRTT